MNLIVVVFDIENLSEQNQQLNTLPGWLWCNDGMMGWVVKCLANIRLGLWWSVEVSCQEEVITGVMRPFVPKYDQGEKPPEDRPGDGGQGSSKEDFQGEPSKTNQQDQEQDQQEREHPEDTYKTTKT